MVLKPADVRGEQWQFVAQGTLTELWLRNLSEQQAQTQTSAEVCFK